MDDQKRAEIKKKIEKLWNSFDHKSDLAKVIEHYYIFGTTDMASNVREDGAPRAEHYRIDEIWEIVKEVQAEKEPAE